MDFKKLVRKLLNMVAELTPFPIYVHQVQWILRHKDLLENKTIMEYPHADVVDSLKKLQSGISSIFREQISSSDGYSTYSKGYRFDNFEIQQHLTFSTSFLLDKGQYTGFEHNTSFIEWSRYGGYIKSGTVNWSKYISELESYSKMASSKDANDRELAYGIIREQYINPHK